MRDDRREDALCDVWCLTSSNTEVERTFVNTQSSTTLVCASCQRPVPEWRKGVSETHPNIAVVVLLIRILLTSRLLRRNDLRSRLEVVQRVVVSQVCAIR